MNFLFTHTYIYIQASTDYILAFGCFPPPTQWTKNKQCYHWDYEVHNSVFIEGSGFASQPIP